MLNDARTRSKMREFLLQWLKVDQPPEIAKDKTAVSGFHAGGGGRPADVARAVPGRRGVERDVGLPRAAAGELAVSQWPAGEALSARSAAGCAVHEDGVGSDERAGRADASVFDGRLRLHGDQLADSSRRVHCSRACWADRCGRRRWPSRRCRWSCTRI